MRTKTVLLIAIFLLALLLRVYRLGVIPALNADEAALGYNAYSLLLTGKDEHGNSWPIHFQSFNDFKPGLTVYLIMPVIGLLGLNVWTVRLLPAVIGAMTPLALYFFVRELRIQKKIKYTDENLEIFSAIFLAISPWHIHFSRGAWEVNVATFFMVLGSLLFIKGRTEGGWYLLSALFFVLSLYTYHSARIVTPLIVVGLVFFQLKDIRVKIKEFVLAGIVGAVLLIPLVIDLIGPAGVSRLSGVGLLADPGPINRANEQRGQHVDPNGLAAEILHNKAVNYGLQFLENWSEHYWGEFLFLSGDDIQRNKVPETGQMHLYDALFVVIGLVFIIRRHKGWQFVLWWLFIAPVAAALTFQSPHALRAQNMVIPLVIISAYGFTRVLQSKMPIYIFLFVVMSLGFVRYLIMYYGHMAMEYPFSSQYGVKRLVNYVADVQDNYDNIIITDRYDQPYILFLFYMQYPPKDFQPDHVLAPRDKFGFSTVRSFGKYRFESIKFDELYNMCSNCLVIGTDEEIPENQKVLRTFHFPNGDIAFEATEIK